MTILIIFVTLALIGMVGISLVNAFALPRLGFVQSESLYPPKSPLLGGTTARLLPLAGGGREGVETPTAPNATPSPKLSVLIPARNEAEVIGRTVERHLAQDYANFELILLDDNSTDGTAEVARTASNGDSRLKIIRGQPLPDGWMGKNWACQQLSQAARGEWLVFTDADVQWQVGSLSAVIAEAERTQADLLTIWPTQQSESWAERLVIPLMAMVVLGYLSIPLVHYTPFAMFAAANGQCMIFRRSAYQRITGHQVVKSEVLEDVVLSRHVKQAGLRLRMADGGGLIQCRMYQNWAEVRNGFAKNILAGYGHSVFFLGLATVFHWLVFVGPWLWLIFGPWLPLSHAWPLGPLTLIGLGVGLRLFTAQITRQRLADSLLMPISVVLMTIIAGQSVWWHWRYGGPKWKGRVIKKG